ncbi:hypothetical protein OEB99_09185 [Actinotalea sp. M2MS4P-6]|uniref:hypothetical protein n=1 Tax=Actinotalea sp. M2MS4P-6 TaxID=2983762 RepID=UPI0021E507BC|nr:hypothetical protein [Actinotalea sp. M2MS4P-6]MCV2394483.1 hypothetical protein [Actinotalea sp. M2MS4P-6]
MQGGGAARRTRWLGAAAPGMLAVVESLSGRTRHHVWRFLAVLVGLVCVVVAYIAGMAVMTVVAMGGVLAIASGDPLPDEPPDLETIAVLLGCLLVFFLMWRLGVRLLRGHRHLVLYLRKFGFTGASAAMSTAIGSGLGRRWRLVTLDDHDTAPLGVGGGRRWLIGLVWLALVVLTGWAVIGAVRWLSSGPADEAMQSAMESAYDQVIAEGGDELTATLSMIIVGPVVALMVGFLILFFGVFFFSLLISVAATGGAMLTMVIRSAGSAEHAKALVITREAEVHRTCTRLRRRTRRVLAPRITIARVADRLWQLTVLQLAAVCDAVIVDVSYPTDNLVWEISSMLRARTRVLPVGRYDRLRAVAADPSPAAVEVRRLLGDREVVGYDPARLDDFSDGLRHSFRVLADRRRSPR